MDITPYLGIPYVSKGRSDEGLDCWGLIHMVYRCEYGINIPSWSNSYKTADGLGWSSVMSIEEAFNAWEEVNKPKPGDIALFQIGRFFHVGLCLDRGTKILHIMKGKNVCIERLDSISLSRTFQGWWRHRDSK